MTNIDNIILNILIIMASIMFVLLIVMIFYILINTAIHNSYHKGYNECRNDEIHYYKSIRDLDESFMDIIRLIDNEGLSFSFKTTQAVIEYTKLIKKYRTKY